MTELPPIPARGVVVRDGHDGFVARVWPSPPLDRRVVGGGFLLFGALGVVCALAVPAMGSLRVQVALSVLGFGVLLIGGAQAQRFMPVEIAVEREALSWNGERIPWSVVSRAVVDGLTLRVLDDRGVELALLFGALPEVNHWLTAELNDAVAEVRGSPAPSAD